MARKNYYKPYKRTSAPRKRWASNLKEDSLAGSGKVLVENALQGSSPTPVIVKAGNFKIQGDVSLQVDTSGTISMFIFLLYCPEGITTSYSDLNASLSAHPEWVMGWTAVDTPVLSSGSTSSGNKFSITSRLKRNLNSGDRIILFMKYSGTASVTATANFTAQYFTCAN